MRTIIKKLIILFPLLFVMVFSFSGFVSAQVCAPECDARFDCVFINPDNQALGSACSPLPSSNPEITIFKAPTLTETFSKLMCSATTLLVNEIMPPIAVLITLIVGFLFLTSGGNPEKVKLANKVLVFSVMGIAVILLSPAIVDLVAEIFNPLAGVSAPDCSVTTGGTNVIVNALINLVNWMAWFVALASVAAGLYSAFLYITSAGNAEQLARASKTFIFAIIGIAVAILSFSVISMVEVFV